MSVSTVPTPSFGSGAFARLRRAIRRRLYRTPALYLPLRNLRRPGTVVTPTTELVIEGFPRCGNTWTEFAIREAQGRPIVMAHHSHAPAQVLAAVRMGRPTLVVIRDPADAVTSMLRMGHGFSGARSLLQEYVDFYSAIEPVRDRIVVASFAEVTQRLNSVIDRLNARFGLELQVLADTPEARANVLARMDARAKEIGDAPEGQSRSNPDRRASGEDVAAVEVREAMTTRVGQAARAVHDRLLSG